MPTINVFPAGQAYARSIVLVVNTNHWLICMFVNQLQVVQSWKAVPTFMVEAMVHGYHVYKEILGCINQQKTFVR